MLFKFFAFTTLLSTSSLLHAESKPPNIILMMADDLGYGDTGFNGNKIIKTPQLDQMAQDGATMTHFYAGGPVCSPTRGTFLTGRHYYRYGIFSANVGHLPRQEITLAEMLKAKGYVTGHFGKLHLGTLSKTESSKGLKRKPEVNFSPPWEHGYDRTFVTESAVGTWDPGFGNRAKNNPFYDDGVALEANDENNLKGGAARVVMDRALPFIDQAVKNKKPFFAIIWFHAPHEDVIAGPKYLDMYKDHGEAAHYYGCITELDEQVGRLREHLKSIGIADNTLICFTSDNGPKKNKLKGRTAGITAGLRGRKRSLYEGGVRVPTLVEWPGKIKPGTIIDQPGSTLDYFPTLQELTHYQMPDDRPIDGQSLLALFKGEDFKRTKPIPFIHEKKSVLIDGKIKLIEGALYDLSKDRSEKNNLKASFPEKIVEMKKILQAFQQSAQQSHSGADYADSSFQPVGSWPGQKSGKKSKSKKKK